MNDTELRGLILQKYYDRRSEDLFVWSAADMENEKRFAGADLLRVCEQLSQYGLIEWRPVSGRHGRTCNGQGRIAAFGVDVIEGKAKPPLAMDVTENRCQPPVTVSPHIQSSDGNVEDANAHLQRLENAIDQSAAPPEEKEEVKSLVALLLASRARDSAHEQPDEDAPVTIPKIISGGQAGADRSALDWAIANNVPHGGWCPKGRRAGDGIIPVRYELTETNSSNYTPATENNILDADGTVIITVEVELPLSLARIKRLVMEHKKPFEHLHTGLFKPGESLREFVQNNRIKILHIAGSRASREPRIVGLVKRFLQDAFFEEPSSLPDHMTWLFS